MRRYLTFITTGTPDQAQGHRVITESEVCGSGLELLADTAIGDFMSTGHSALETWSRLLAIGLPSDDLRSAFDRLGLTA